MSETIIKALIESLKQGPLTNEEADKIILSKKSIPNEEALRKRRVRYLDKLKSLGLAIELDGKFCWYTYENLYETYDDYYSRIQHSTLLIPGLEELARIRKGTSHAQPFESLDPLDLKIITSCAREHIQSYAETYHSLRNFEAKEKEENDKKLTLETRIIKKLDEKLGRPIDPFEGMKLPRFVGRNIASLISSKLIYEEFGFSLDLVLNGEEILANNKSTLIAKGSDMLLDLERFIGEQIHDVNNISSARQIRQITLDENKYYEKVQNEIRTLIIGIKGGEPIRGKCKLCPKILIKKKRNLE
jgi:hypothetical protein